MTFADIDAGNCISTFLFDPYPSYWVRERIRVFSLFSAPAYFIVGEIEYCDIVLGNNVDFS